MKKISILFLIILLILVAFACLYFTKKVSKPAINPNCLFALVSFESEDKSVDVSSCKDNNYTFADGMYSADLSQYEGYDNGWFDYRVLSHIGSTYDLFVEWSGGGTGVFTNIVEVSLKNNILSLDKYIASGDRCNGGIISDSIQTKNGVLIFAQELTPFDIVRLASSSLEKVSEELEYSAVSCFAEANHTYSMGAASSTIVSIDLGDEKVQKQEGWTDTYNYQSCFNDQYNAYIDAKHTHLSIPEWDQFVQKFVNTCTQ